jgi:alpha-galactosidase
MDPIYLRSAGVSVLIGFGSSATPQAEIVHWGGDLGDTLPDLDILRPPIPHSAYDEPVVAGLLPQASAGWSGRPGLRGSRAGLDFSPAFQAVTAEVTDDGRTAHIRQRDELSGLEVLTSLTLHAGGLLELVHELTNTGSTAYRLDELATVLPIPPAATEILDLTGRWCRESHPQRSAIREGTWVRSGRHARTGHDSALLVAAGTPDFGNRTGRVWAIHFAWSGDHEQFLDAAAGRRMLGATELLGSGEVELSAGASYRTPTLYAAYSDRGIDGVTEQFYDWFRSRPQHPRSPRPVVLNTWEAVYFDHRLEPLIELAETAAELGVERFVLDDGWFQGRRNDRVGLGDWIVDPDVWPDGLHPLIDAVRSRGMEFGLWVEPEMINLDSDLARRHPDWIARPTLGTPADGGRLPREWRHQQVLDLVNPDAWQYVYDRLDALLEANDIAYLKWDQNRDLSEQGHAGRPSVHAQTLALYRLMDALKAAHPAVEIESCSSGGARVDLGILQRTDRVWASDCNDALERQTIQRWTQAVVPPELVGSHVGPPVAHTTGRTHDIAFRAITALFGHFGIEWDVRQASAHERDVLARTIALYKRHRALLHTGVRVDADLPDAHLALHGVVAHDGSEGLFAAVVLASLVAESPGRVSIPGLDSDRRYRVEALLPAPLDAPHTAAGSEQSSFVQTAPPAWFERGAVASGAFLSEVGLPLPILGPERALLMRVVAES